MKIDVNDTLGGHADLGWNLLYEILGFNEDERGSRERTDPPRHDPTGFPRWVEEARQASIFLHSQAGLLARLRKDIIDFAENASGEIVSLDPAKFESSDECLEAEALILVWLDILQLTFNAKVRSHNRCVAALDRHVQKNIRSSRSPRNLFQLPPGVRCLDARTNPGSELAAAMLRGKNSAEYRKKDRAAQAAAKAAAAKAHRKEYVAAMRRLDRAAAKNSAR